MLITYYEDGSTAPKRLAPVLLGLMIANATFSALILFAWTYIAFFVAEPFAWAIWMPISRGYGIVGVFEYPFILLWLMPLIGIFGAWVGIKGKNKVLAYAFVGVPLVMVLLVFGWFYIAPPDWH